MTETFDVAIVGAGMAGASIAAECAPHARVLLIEAEDAPGYHTTGRSAAFWNEAYGGVGLHALTVASGPFLREGGFLFTRGALTIGRAQDRDRVEAFAQGFGAMGVRMEMLDRAALAAKVPGLVADWCVGAWEPTCADVDVAALHQHYLAACRRAGTVVRLRARVDRLESEGGTWRLAWTGADGGGEARATFVVNAAGAWADAVAELAGAAPLGVQPLRRTMVQLRTDPVPPVDMPLTLGIDADFYCKPQAGRLWLTPHDETPDVARDAAPEELDVALAIDRMGSVLDWKVQALERRWAGLRCFTPDRLPVYGFDPARPGFFWCAGQGGAGIQTAPAAARMAARMLLGLDADAMTAALDPAPFAPGRFARSE